VRSAARARIARMARDQMMQPRGVAAGHVGHDLHHAMAVETAGLAVELGVGVFFVDHRLQFHHRHVAQCREGAVLVEHIGDAAGHAGGEIAAGLASTTTTPPVMYSQQ